MNGNANLPAVPVGFDRTCDGDARPAVAIASDLMGTVIGWLDLGDLPLAQGSTITALGAWSSPVAWTVRYRGLPATTTSVLGTVFRALGEDAFSVVGLNGMPTAGGVDATGSGADLAADHLATRLFEAGGRFQLTIQDLPPVLGGLRSFDPATIPPRIASLAAATPGEVTWTTEGGAVTPAMSAVTLQYRGSGAGTEVRWSAYLPGSPGTAVFPVLPSPLDALAPTASSTVENESVAVIYSESLDHDGLAAIVDRDLERWLGTLALPAGDLSIGFRSAP